MKKNDVAAFIVEPIQGEGGVIVPPAGYLNAAKELCHRYGALFVVDEIQTGLGRTGKMFACDHEGVEPDVMCLAKSLGGGIMPIGAFITTEEIWNAAYGGVEKCLLHTSTFGGNTWATAAGIAALEVIQTENLPQRPLAGRLFAVRLTQLTGETPLSTVRGKGLLVGVEFEQPAKGIMAKLAGAINKLASEYLGSMVAGVLLNEYRIITAYTLNNPNVIRLEPPLVVSREQIDVVLNALDETFHKNRSLLGFSLTSGKTFLSSMLRKK